LAEKTIKEQTAETMNIVIKTIEVGETGSERNYRF